MYINIITDFFITMTMNPNSKSVTDELRFNEHPNDRPDIIARCFDLESHELTEDLYNNGILGEHLCHVHVMEWQKRGLPHKHILLTVKKDWKLKTPADIDSAISAVIPDKVSNIIYILNLN